MLTFDEATHTYRLKGRGLPSVSSVCDLILGGSYGDIPEEVLRKAADFGTEVHKAIEDWNEGKRSLPEICESFEEPDIDKKLFCLQEWIRLSQIKGIEILHSEQMGHYEGLFCGTFDMVGKEGDKTYIYDYKTTYNLHEERVSLQLSLYRLIYGWDEVDGIKVVWLPKRKKGEIRELESWNKEALLETVYMALGVVEMPIDLGLVF